MFIFGIYDNKFLNYYAFYLRFEPIVGPVLIPGKHERVSLSSHFIISENLFPVDAGGSFHLKICHNMWKVFRSEESGDCP
jgi:hypothetical protein